MSGPMMRISLLLLNQYTYRLGDQHLLLSPSTENLAWHGRYTNMIADLQRLQVLDEIINLLLGQR